MAKKKITQLPETTYPLSSNVAVPVVQGGVTKFAKLSEMALAKENTVNKSTTMTGNETSNVLFLTAKAVYDWAIALFQKKATATTGNTIQFDCDRIYNSITSPTTGAMTNDLTGAQIGVIQKIYYNHSTTNPFPAGWVRLGSKTYTPSALNIIYAEWVGGSRVEYWISQEA